MTVLNYKVMNFFQGNAKKFAKKIPSSHLISQEYLDSSTATASTDAESPTPSSNKRLLLLCGSDAGRERDGGCENRGEGKGGGDGWTLFSGLSA